jgi:hypothetical protein
MPLHTAIVVQCLRVSPPLAELFVPLVDARREVRVRDDLPALTAGIITAATGELVTADDVEVLTAYPGDIMLLSAPRATEVRHPETRLWYRGLRLGWASDLSRSWCPVISYQVGALQWERVVPAGMWRLDPMVGHGPLHPAPRTERGTAPGRGAS